MPQKVLGAFEKVSFPEFGMKNLISKIDTGAFTGSLHCTKTHTEIENGITVLHFSPFDNPKEVHKTSLFTEGSVKSSNGTKSMRYFIETKIAIGGEIYPITLTLADRSDMRWPVLIGRRFLAVNDFIVDVTKQND